ncbi:hypothetical protein HU200_060900 [Digitaria exilis]|uniref:SCP domain-containing protein n=1 Tax=Digitaria exilis TaxID=1010633 RepID=A0A835A870_9POAL|nr:hypothetical protein HU200_060900 [Digitaria exilis]
MFAAVLCVVIFFSDAARLAAASDKSFGVETAWSYDGQSGYNQYTAPEVANILNKKPLGSSFADDLSGSGGYTAGIAQHNQPPEVSPEFAPPPPPPVISASSTNKKAPAAAANTGTPTSARKAALAKKRAASANKKKAAASAAAYTGTLSSTSGAVATPARKQAASASSSTYKKKKAAAAVHTGTPLASGAVATPAKKPSASASLTKKQASVHAKASASASASASAGAGTGAGEGAGTAPAYGAGVGAGAGAAPAYGAGTAAPGYGLDAAGEPEYGLNQKAIDDIVREHNMFRAREHVPPLTWNATLAKFSQEYAETLNVKKDCKMLHSSSPYGENMMQAGSDGITWKTTIDEWSDEKKSYHYGTNSCDPGKTCGHYTAVVWKGTTTVGCGRVKCNNGDTMIMCSYWPPGNYNGTKPF